MKNIVDVATGEVKKGESNDILSSHGIGSCIVVAAINLEKQICALAHIMLPGIAPLKQILNETKYAENAIERMLQLLQTDKNDTSKVKVCLVGAGNVLNKPNDKICESNIESVTRILNNLHIKIDAKSLGGNNRRTVEFDVENCEVYFTEGNSKLELLKSWNYNRPT